MSTHQENGYVFDHGAQYFTARDERFRRYVESWLADGLVQLWKGKIAVIRDGQISAERAPTERWVGTPGMNAVPEHMAADVTVDYNVLVTGIQNEGKKWLLTASSGKTLGRFDIVIVALPPIQAANLIEAVPEIQASLRKVHMKPCRAVMAAFDRPLNMTFEAAFFHDSPVSWAARNNSKPGRLQTECWVMHATSQWSENNLAQDDTSDQSLIRSFFESAREKPKDPVFQFSKFWRFAQAENPLKEGCIWSNRLRIGVCGDWCQMSRIEGAFLSGMAIAGRVLGLKQ
jgi:predicted NAD/FAD-dependent oxidoreductase